MPTLIMKRSISILGNGRYSVGEHQQFTDRENRLVRVIKESPKNPVAVGEAYTFFDCKASREEIEKELPTIRQISNTPDELELYLTQEINPDNFRHPELREVAKQAKKAGIKYSIKANYVNATNEKTASELTDIMRNAYASPLYAKGEDFRCRVLYRD